MVNEKLCETVYLANQIADYYTKHPNEISLSTFRITADLAHSIATDFKNLEEKEEFPLHTEMCNQAVSKLTEMIELKQ